MTQCVGSKSRVLLESSETSRALAEQVALQTDCRAVSSMSVRKRMHLLDMDSTAHSVSFFKATSDRNRRQGKEGRKERSRFPICRVGRDHSGRAAYRKCGWDVEGEGRL